jgi:ferredoxin-NADP reductase
MDSLTAPPAAASSAHLPPHQTGLIDARVTAIEDVARDTKLYTFARVDGGKLPPYAPGAHIDLHLPNGLVRQFSLVVPDSSPDKYVVGVKRDAASRGGSSYIIDQMRVGDQLKISPPRNNFPLVENAEHVVLVAGGIGITPIWCMVQQLVALKQPWKLYYACQSRQDMAFLEDLKKLDPSAVHLHFDDEAEGKFLDLAGAIEAASQDAHFYCCGPNPMLKAFETAAASRPRGNIHIEYFTPKDDGTSAHMGGF